MQLNYFMNPIPVSAIQTIAQDFMDKALYIYFLCFAMKRSLKSDSHFFPKAGYPVTVASEALESISGLSLNMLLGIGTGDITEISLRRDTSR